MEEDEQIDPDGDGNINEQADEKQNDEERLGGDAQQAPAMNPIHQWLHSINMATYWPSFQANGCTFWGAVDSLTDNDLLLMNIIMVGHRRHILKELRMLNARLSGAANLLSGDPNSGAAVGLGVIGVAAQPGLGARGGAIGVPVSMAAIAVSLHGQTFARIMKKCHGLTLSKTLAKLASTTSKVMFVPIMSKTNDDGRKCNSNYQICKSMVFWINRWNLGHVNNYRDPSYIARQIGGGGGRRGGSRYHTGTLILHGINCI